MMNQSQNYLKITIHNFSINVIFDMIQDNDTKIFETFFYFRKLKVIIFFNTQNISCI